MEKSNHVKKTRLWEEWIEVAREYREEEHGDLLVPTNFKIRKYALGYWIKEKRRMYWKRIHADSQIQDLDELGMGSKFQA